MKRKSTTGALRAFAVFAAVCAVLLGARAQSDAGEAGRLARGFANPPNEAKPRTWWHWMNGNVTKQGLTADLEAMARAGIGGAHIFDVGCNIPAGDVAFNTPTWDDYLRHAIREAGRLGLELTLVNCSGFANAGGPWVAPSNSTFLVTCSETTVKGGMRPSKPLARAQNDHGFYRDIAVLAFPQPTCEAQAPKDVKVASPKQNVFVVSADKPMTVRGLRLGMYLDVSWAWDRWLKFAVETSEDGLTWKDAGSVETMVINGGKSDCNGGDEKLFAFDKPYVARFIRFTGDATRCHANYGDSSKARIVVLKPVFQRALQQLNERTLRSSQVVTTPAGDSMPDEAIDKSRIVDLTKRLAADGSLDWTAPAGEDWIVLRIGYASNGMKCHPATPFGEGPEVDKLDADAVRRHLEAYALKYAGMKGVAGVLCDSYEVGSQNWTHGLEKIFETRRGYSLVPYLAAFSGRVVGSARETDNALRDYRRTVSDLFCENFAGASSELCARHGMVSAMEPYGNGPFNNTSYAWYTSQPMTEFWVDPEDGADNYTRANYCVLAHRVASSAHLRGIPFVDAEGFTAAPQRGGRWLKDPFGLKAYGDLMYACGVTRMVYHRWAHQPWTEPARLPGMTMGPWGTHFERTETWWPMVGPWLTYQARCQYLLQQGSVVADVLAYDGDDVPAVGVDPAKMPVGIGWDVCGKEALAELTVKNGKLKCRSATEYSVLFVPDIVWVSPESAQRIAALKAQGVKVVYDVKDLNVVPDFTFRGTTMPVKAIHRAYGDGLEGYFVAYPATNAATVTCSFRVTGKAPQFWDPETGAVSTPRVWREKDGRTEVEIAFKPCGATFVMFAPKDAPKPPLEDMFVESAAETLEGPWTLAFPKGWNCPEKVALEKLVSWTEIPDGEVKYFSGVATYAYAGKAPAAAVAKGSRVVLDLGRVKNLAEVTVNGKTFEPLWRPPFRADVTDALREDGSFDLVVRVANLWPNRLIGDAKKGEDCEWNGPALKEIPAWVKEGKPSPIGRLTFTTWRHWRADEALLPSGLLGPVRLTVSAAGPRVAQTGGF